MKKSIMAIVSLVLAGTMAFGLAACDQTGTPEGDGGDKHEHAWSVTGTDNGDGTHTLTCSGDGVCDEGGSKKEEHNSKGADGECTVCGYDPNEDDGKTDEGGEGDGNTVVNKELLDAIGATLSEENYKMSLALGVNLGITLDGQIVEADTVIVENHDPEGDDFTGADLLTMLVGGITGSSSALGGNFENPVYLSAQTVTYVYDLESGTIEEIYTNGPSTQTFYYEVDGTTINYYYQQFKYDNDGNVVGTVQYKHSYTGYADNAQAKEVMKKNSIRQLEGAPFVMLETIVNSKVKGLGENAGKEGTLKELEALFTYDQATKSYSATVDASSVGGDMYSNCEVVITVEDGKVTDLVMTLDGDALIDSLLSLLPEMPEGVGFELSIDSSAKYGDFGATVTVPAEWKNVDANNTHVTPVITKSVWEELFADYNTTEFALEFSGETRLMDGVRYESYTYYVDTRNKNIMLYNSWEGGSSRTYFYSDGDKVYQAIYNSFENNYYAPSESDITGDEVDALISAASSYVFGYYLTDYLAGFEEGELKDLFDKFEYSSVDRMSANLTLNGKAVEVTVSYSYNDFVEQGYYDITVSVKYLEGEVKYFSFSPLSDYNKQHLADYHPDNFKEDEGDSDNND